MARTQDVIHIEILNWDKFNPRRDVKTPSWFRLEYKLVDDPEFHSFTHEEFKAWIYILSMACRKNSGTISIYCTHAESSARIKKAGMHSAVQKLEELQLVRVTSNLAYADVTHTLRHGQTDERTNERNGTETPEQRPPAAAVRVHASFASLEQVIQERKISETLQAAWLKVYPDPPWVITEIRKALAWEAANPKRRKVNFGAFMGNWLARAWDQRKLPPGRPASVSDWQSEERKRRERELDEIIAQQTRKAEAARLKEGA